jgi:hypothetical protein
MAASGQNPGTTNSTLVSKSMSGWKPVPADGVISSSGRYRLQQDTRIERRTGIEIQADHVTLDLAGHALRYMGAPSEGTYGIAAKNRSSVTISNGTIGGFWFNIHCTENRQLRMNHIQFEDIPYIGVNVLESKDVTLSDNSFSNFRYNLSKTKESAYLIGINIGAQDAIITSNRFVCRHKARHKINVETVFVLLSADVSKNCLVEHNEMTATDVLPRSYGVWVATRGQATISRNNIRNMNYGVCLSAEASALVCFNQFSASEVLETNASIETFGITAVEAKDISAVNNTFEGVSTPSLLPKSPDL